MLSLSDTMVLEEIQELCGRGNLLLERGQLEAAIGDFEEIHKKVAREIGLLRAGQNYWNLALPYLEIAAKTPGDHYIQYMLARAYRLHRRFEEALICMRVAFFGMSIAELKEILDLPETVEALAAISDDVGMRQGRYGEIVELYQRAVAASPDSPALLNNLAVAHSFVGQFEETARLLTRLIALDGSNFLARINLGMCYVRMDRRVEAVAQFETCDRMGFEGSEVLGGLIEQKSALCSWDGLMELRARLAQALDDPSKEQHVALTYLQAHFDDATRMLRWTKRIAARAYKADGIACFESSAVGRGHRRIRVGYYSPHYYDNPVAHLTAGLYALHDRSAFEVFIYAYGPDDGHPVRKRIADSVEHFLSIEGESEAQMAQRIRQDEIDILIDLSANLGWSKPKTLVYRAAPVQVNWLGFIGTMGVAAYDYILSDGFATPEGFDDFYAEKIVRLPHTFQCTDAARPHPAQVVSRQDLGLPVDAFVFSNCGQLYKIQPEVFEVWTRIVAAVPNSVLWLVQGHPAAEDNLRNEWAKTGLAQNRLIFSPRVPGDIHLSRIGAADLFLDTYPYGSGTIANDVLWAGLPLLSLAGETMVSRMAGSLLNALGLPELVTCNMQAYEKQAIHYATHLEQLAELRERLAKNRTSWPLFDTPRFVRNLERAYTQMVERAQAGLPPASITVVEEPR